MPTQSQHAFSEKVVLITDGASPIGRAIAMQLGLYGAFVVVGNPNTSDTGDTSAIDELRSLGTLAHSINLNVSGVPGAKQMVGEVEGIYGRLDALVNCGIYRADSTFEETDEEIFDQMVGRNLKSAFFVTQEALRLMDSRPNPKIVNVTADPESQDDIAFALVNHGIEGLTRSLAKTLPDKFRVNAVAVSSGKKTDSKNDLDKDLFRRSKGVDPDDVARTVLYLLSPESKAVNGQIFKVG